MPQPRILITSGDPAGIGPELVDKLLADPGTLAKADVILIGQRGQVRVPDGVRWHDWAGAEEVPSLCVFEVGPDRVEMKALSIPDGTAEPRTLDTKTFLPR